MVISYIISGLFIFMGVGIKYFKWDFLISGYNTMNKNQKQNVDIEGLRKAIGNFLFLMAGILLISSITDKMGYKSFSFITMILFLPLTIAFVAFVQKYDHNTNAKLSKFNIKAGLIILLIILIPMLSLLIYGSREPIVEVSSDRITIKGTYGVSIERDDIEEITLEGNIPKILQKTNGFDLGYILRGNFRLEGIGHSKIYIHENKSPYIVIKTDKRYYIINYRNSEKTEELYKRIMNY